LAGRQLPSTNTLRKSLLDGRARPEERLIVRAARLRLSIENKQDIESPSRVKKIAKRPLWP
jgi:hypothetical protein